MREKTARTDVRTEPDLKADYAAFCEGTMKVSVSERTRYLWRVDMAKFGQEDERESAA